MKHIESHLLTIIVGLSIGVFYPSVKLLVTCLVLTAIVSLWRFQTRPPVRRFKPHPDHVRHIPITEIKS